MTYQLHCGDCLNIMPMIERESVDAIVTDPPAGISFMGKDWDSNRGGRDKWIVWMTTIAYECMRVLKPGAHALVWSLPRTSHWTATAWENAGFEPRDRITHIFGQGFPKNLDVEKQLEAEIIEQIEARGIKFTGWLDEQEPETAQRTEVLYP